jgi:hypothetical protein
MKLSQADVVAWLRGLPDKRFFQVLYEAAEGREADVQDRAWLQSHVVLGRASREISQSPAAWSIELVGLPPSPDVWADDEVVA